MRKEVLISGIQRKVKGKNFEDGSLSDMINVRVKDKNWVGVGDKVLFFDLEVTALTYHIHDLGLDGIGIVHVYEVGETLTIKVTFVKDGDEVGAQTLKSDIPLGTKVHLSSLNNILIVNGLGSIEYYVYEGIKDLYRFIPPMPEPLKIEPYYKDKGIGQYLDTEHLDSIIDTLVTYRPDATNPKLSNSRPINGYKEDGYEIVEKYNSALDAGGNDKDLDNVNIITKLNSFYRNLNDENGVIVGEFFLVAAYRLFDGSIIKPTAPISMKCSFVDLYQEYCQYDKYIRYLCGAASFKRPLRIKFDLSQLNSISTDYDGIITGVQLFVSKSISFKTKVYDFIGDNKLTGSVHINCIWGDLSLNEIGNMHNLNSFVISELLKNPEYFEYPHEIKSFDNTSQALPIMPIDNFTHHSIQSTQKVFTYNSRLIMSNIKSKLFDGFKMSNADNYHLSTSNNYPQYRFSYSIGIVVTVVVDGETVELFSGWESSQKWYATNITKNPFTNETIAPIYVNCVPFSFNPHFIYPDSRACKVKFLLRMNDGTIPGTIWSKGYVLKPHNFMNLSYVENRPSFSVTSYNKGRLIPSYNYIYETDSTYDDKIAVLINGSKVLDDTPTSGILGKGEPYFTFYNPITLTYPSGKTPEDHQPDMVREYNFVEPVNTSRTDQNRVQVSELNNPFIFPAKNSYRVGNGSIKALVNVTQEFGSGQFGEYPIVAFTDDGIWALAIGQGDLFISHVVPLAKDTTNNPDTISVVRDGIFFASDTGLKLLVGKESVHVSDIIEGSIRVQSGILRAILYELGKYAKENELSKVDFKEYIENCRIGYDRTNEEMIISNPDPEYGYSYVYMFNSKLWTKRSEVFDSFLNSYPYTIGQRGTNLYNTSKEGEIDKRYMMLTNPIEFNEDSFTKLQSLVVRGFHGHTNLQVFGTTDNINYKLILSTQTTQDSQDLHLKRAFYSCKAYVVFISGEVKDSHYINRIEVMLSQKFNNKLR